MIHQFLPGMIERQRGRIVAVSSMFAKMSVPLMAVYTATKYGLDGFMEALFDELCIDDYEKFIKLSTIFPYIMNTRKEVVDMMGELDDPVPRMDPAFVADKTVKNVLMDKRRIVITPQPIHRIVQ